MASDLLDGVAEERLAKIKKKKMMNRRPSGLVPDKLSQYKYTEELKIINPFEFQVAGHDAILRVAGAKLCKPIKAREFWFYTSPERPSYLDPFLPTFLGYVVLSRTELEELIRTALAKTKNGLNGEKELQNEEWWHPWSIQMHHARLLEFETFEQSHYEYIILEDLTYSYKYPSILDCKMGARQHDDDAHPEKIASQIRKNSTTTSASLGFRVCGMQVWEPENQHYRHMHKYEGRSITVDTVERAIQGFFCTANTLRLDCLEGLLVQLRSIERIFSENPPPFRFYATSLLFLYEGHVEDRENVKTDVKMIDFAHTFPKGDAVDDSAYLLGLRNLINIFEKLLRSGNDSCNNRV